MTQNQRAGLLRPVAVSVVVSIFAYCVTGTIAAILEQVLLGTFSPIL